MSKKVVLILDKSDAKWLMKHIEKELEKIHFRNEAGSEEHATFCNIYNELEKIFK